jgi:hypothetical protein
MAPPAPARSSQIAGNRSLGSPDRRPVHWLNLECLEDRSVPSLYDLDVIARGGLDGLSAVGPNVSINDAGKVAFVGRYGSGLQDLFVGGESAAAPRYVTGNQLLDRDFGQSVQINNNDQIVARIRDAGAPALFQVRVWDGSPEPRSTTTRSSGAPPAATSTVSPLTSP